MCVASSSSSQSMSMPLLPAAGVDAAAYGAGFVDAAGGGVGRALGAVGAGVGTLSRPCDCAPGCPGGPLCRGGGTTGGGGVAGAAIPSNVFLPASPGGSTGRCAAAPEDCPGGGAGRGPGAEGWPAFFFASPSKMSRSEPLLSAIEVSCTTCALIDPSRVELCTDVWDDELVGGPVVNEPVCS